MGNLNRQPCIDSFVSFVDFDKHMRNKMTSIPNLFFDNMDIDFKETWIEAYCESKIALNNGNIRTFINSYERQSTAICEISSIKSFKLKTQSYERCQSSGYDDMIFLIKCQYKISDGETCFVLTWHGPGKLIDGEWVEYFWANQGSVLWDIDQSKAVCVSTQLSASQGHWSPTKSCMETRGM